ncbi:Mycinamicin VI 2''-O-methyltransferase [Legionella massiliensis]|uniref:Mycinamicin VI 2''-O-methyltransferase n=1 Tax=Legionella massiliensis TaxID=1034943 RepID=A0A078KYJ0_9GAMM|nr:class I SAM-dependent methyltransferase [Legionella massiliensis]CDZ76844.1 Mycinamicin VI 2''-O-methyltransferase [Legionella massiliensis]CEE12582.1 Mycinamicin VI 2''-O-methyltransferase [Legionella massiliensis]
MNLYSYFMTQSGLQMIKNAHYFQAYERHLQHLVNRPVLLFEIGTGEGGSSLMWKQYFGPLARIVTIDIRECRKKLDNSQVFVRIGDQSDEQFLSGLLDEFGSPDVVIDDGSHHMDDVNRSFTYLYPRMTRDGIYIVEDLNTAYWEEFGGGVKSPGSFIERCKTLIDELNAMHTRNQVAVTDFSKSTSSIHFYNMLIVFERAPYQNTELLQLPLSALP